MLQNVSVKLEHVFKTLPLKKVQVTDRLLGGLQGTIKATTLEMEYAQCEQTGRIQNFHRVARGERGTFKGRYYNDSDVYKWAEAAAMMLEALGPDPETERRLQETVEAIAAAQEPSGYLDTFLQLNEPDHKFANLGALHEMYVMGHLIEAAVAHHAATGERTLLKVAIKLADHLDSVFGPGKRIGYCGHEEIELALVKLAIVTGEQRYRKLAQEMINRRGQSPRIFQEELKDPVNQRLSPWMARMLGAEGDNYSGTYVQDHLPVRETREVVGHSVRAMYLYAGCTDAFAGENDTEMEQALEAIWTNMVERRMYVTGGIGDEGAHEGFTGDYHLPNRTAYAETCAACGVIFWAQRLVNCTGNAEYADILETALYNGALAGLSLDGKKFFYDNPLESLGGHHRQEWFDCACCPPNIARLIASLGAYVCSASESAFAVVLPCGFETKAEFNGVPTTIKVAADLLQSGSCRISVDPESATSFELKVRIPSWSVDTEFEAPDNWGEFDFKDGFACLNREWSKGDTFVVQFDLSPRWLRAHPKNLDCAGRVALQRGPFLYCAEEAANGFAPQRFEVDMGAEIEVDGAELCVSGLVDAADGGAGPYEEDQALMPRTAKLKMIPYYAWDNGEPGTMQVWLRARG